MNVAQDSWNDPISQENSADTQRTNVAVSELIHGCEDAVRDHYFKEIYPARIRERALRIRRLAEWLDEQAATGDHRTLDQLDALLLPPFEQAAKEHSEIIELLRQYRWLPPHKGMV